MIANYPIRIGVLEQGSRTSIPLAIPAGTGLFLDVRLLGAYGWGSAKFRLPLQDTNPEGLIDWGDGSPIEIVPAGSTGVIHTYPSDTGLFIAQTKWLMPAFNRIQPHPSIYVSGEFMESAGSVAGYTGKGTYSGTDTVTGAFGYTLYNPNADLVNITGLRNINSMFANYPALK